MCRLKPALVLNIFLHSNALHANRCELWVFLCLLRHLLLLKALTHPPIPQTKGRLFECVFKCWFIRYLFAITKPQSNITTILLARMMCPNMIFKEVPTIELFVAVVYHTDNYAYKLVVDCSLVVNTLSFGHKTFTTSSAFVWLRCWRMNFIDVSLQI